MQPAVEYRYIETNGIRLHVAEAGPEDGPLVVLLHGFPEFWYGWRNQIPALAGAGFHVLAPDQRGYNLSDKPRPVGAYGIDELGNDIVGLITSTGARRATIVGHDWGAAVAWWLASQHPKMIDRLVILNVPHGAVMLKQLRGNIRQLLRSWYIFMFQIPWLPEAAARRNNWSQIVRVLRKTSRSGTFSDADLDQYRAAWSQPGAYRSMIHWYRALFRARPRLPSDSRIHVPTLLIWGRKDQFLGAEMAQPSIDLCDDGELVFIDEATHWVQHEEAERVNELILSFIS